MKILTECDTVLEVIFFVLDLTGQYVNRIIKKKDRVVNKTFVQMMESLGYDIELTYVKRG